MLTDKPWHCPRCDARVGDVDAEGHLSVGNILVEYAKFTCRRCGYVKHWRATDTKLLGKVKDGHL